MKLFTTEAFPADWAIDLWRALVCYTAKSGSETSSHRLEQAKKLVNLAMLAAVLVPIFSLYYLIIGLPDLAAGLGLSGLGMIANLWVYRRTGSVRIAGEVFLASLYIFLAWATYRFGSVVSPSAIWLAALPVVGLLLSNAKSGCVWLIVVLCTLVAIYGIDVREQPTASWPEHFFLASLAGVIVAIFIFVLMIDAARRKAHSELEAANAAMKELAQRDSLTGLYNRRYIWEALEREEKSAKASSTSFTMLLIDIDRFKMINDKFGHMMGDIVLKSVAVAITKVIPEHQLCGRYGGEEFLLLLRAGSELDDGAIAEQLRQEIALLRFDHVGGPKIVTVSIGLSQSRLDETFGDTFRRADEALYVAKRSGRNRVCSAQLNQQLTEVA